MEERTRGQIQLAVLTAAFLYYSFWVLLTPFIEPGQPIHRLFPRREWALLLPTIPGILLFSTVTGFAGALILRDAAGATTRAKIS